MDGCLRRQVSRTAVLGALVVCLLGACGAVPRELGMALEATRAAREGLVTWSDEAQARIFDEAKSQEEGERLLKDHRARRDKADALLTIAQTAIALAETDPTAQNLAVAVKAVAEAYGAVNALRDGGN